MGTCESRPHEGNDIQITTDPRFMKGKEPTEPGSPSFPTSKQFPSGGYTPYQDFNSSAPNNWQNIEGSQVPIPIRTQKHALTFGKPVEVYPEKEPDTFVLYPVERSYSPPKGLGSNYKKNYEAKTGRNERNDEFEHPQQEQSPMFFEEEDLPPIEADVERFSIPRDSFSYPDIDSIIYEGYLLKYKPGTNFNWVERWCVVSRREFKYYKDQWSAKCWDNKPLLSIPISQIITTLRVNLNLPDFEIKKETFQAFSFKNNSLKTLFHFEIFDQRNDFLNPESPENEEQRHGASQQSARRLSQDNSLLSPRDGYLMRPPLTYRTYRKTQGSGSPSPNISQNTTQIIDSAGEKQKESPSQFKKGSSSKMSVTNRGELISKWNKKRADLASWTGRENEWYYSEKRLLFATPNIADREKWVGVLEWVVHEDDAQYNNM